MPSSRRSNSIWRHPQPGRASFDPAAVTGETLRENSYELKIQEYNKALKKEHHRVFVRFIPTFTSGSRPWTP
jgi:hypothetical protein